MCEKKVDIHHQQGDNGARQADLREVHEGHSIPVLFSQSRSDNIGRRANRSCVTPQIAPKGQRPHQRCEGESQIASGQSNNDRQHRLGEWNVIDEGTHRPTYPDHQCYSHSQSEIAFYETHKD